MTFTEASLDITNREVPFGCREDARAGLRDAAIPPIVAPRAEGALRRRLGRDLRVAVAEGGLVLRYRPRLALAGGTLVAAEAVLCWPHPRYGLIAPSTFLPIAERSGLGFAISAYVLGKTCADASQWPVPAGRQRAPRVSLRVSARQLLGDALIRQIADALEDSRLDPGRLELEFPEGELIGARADTLLTLASLCDHGVRLVLGVGPVSLTTLKALPLTGVKMDRDLVRGLPSSAADAVIVRALVRTAHALGLSVAAAGIENEAERTLLAALGCDEGVGDLCGRPEPAAAFRTRPSFALGYRNLTTP